MSATNTTTNYGLPIFIETDKPAWLVDFNGAMRAIDTQMKTNADAIATKSPILTFNDTSDIDFTKSGDIVTANLASNVSDKVGRALITPIAPPSSEEIVTINSSGNQSAAAVGSGLSLNNGVLTAADLNLSNTGRFTISKNVSDGVLSDTFSYAFNADRTIGKVYGVVQITGAVAGQYDLTLSGIQANVTEAFNIYPGGIACFGSTTRGVRMHLDADGTIHAIFNASVGSGTIILFPTVTFFKNFGD